MPHVMELLASTDPYMPDSVIICRWLFGDWSPGDGHPVAQELLEAGAATADPPP